MRHSLVVLAAVAVAMMTASPQSALALDQDDLDTLSRHGAASFEAFAKFGDVGETLSHIGSSKFSGTGSQRRAMSRQVDSAMQPWRDASAAAKGSLSYKLVPSAMLATDIATSFIAPTMEGDIRGAMSGAVNIAVAPTVVGSFTAIGTGAGAMFGSFVPVVGNALGGMVGGAVGTVVGGYISAYAYDKYVKEMVSKAVEGGIAAVFDTSPLQQAMQAKQAFLHENASPEVKAEWDRMNAVSRSFGGGEGQVLDWERLPYIVEQKPVVPDRQQQAALPQAPALPPMTRFEIRISSGSGGATVDDCRIDGEQVSCVSRWENPPSWLVSYSGAFTGRLSGATVTGTTTSHITNRNARGCIANEDYSGPLVIELNSGGVVHLQAGPIQRRTVFSGACSGANSGSSKTNRATAQWRVLE